MSFSNLEYLYFHLPSRYRREDKELFLKRFLQFFGDTLDSWDNTFDTFYQQINADTASEEFVDWWMWALFGWSWYPKFFNLSDKRTLYRNFAKHLARRGTAQGIQLWLSDFHVNARIYTRPAYWGEWTWGESNVYVSEPLLIVVEIISAQPNDQIEMSAYSDACWGESIYADYEPLYTTSELLALFRFVQPNAQEILLIPIQHVSSQENYFLRSN